MRIDRERGCYRISFESSMDLVTLQRRIEECGECIDGIITSGELSREGDSYVLCIRHRESLKDYLEHHIFDLLHFVHFLRRLRVFLECLRKQQLCIYDCAWDVDCIFVGNNIDVLEFVYIPGISCSTEGGCTKSYFRFSDMLAVASLRVYETEISALQMLSEVVGAFSKWEDEVLLPGAYCDTPFIEGERKLLSFCGNRNPFVQSVKKAFEAIRAPKVDSSERNIELPISFQIKKHFRLCLEGIGRLKGQKISLTADASSEEEKCWYIGRETNFAAMCLPYPVISRRHATLSCRDGVWFLTDTDSVNGTFLDHIRINPGTGYPLIRGHEFYFAHQEIGFRVRRI